MSFQEREKDIRKFNIQAYVSYTVRLIFIWEIQIDKTVGIILR